MSGFHFFQVKTSTPFNYTLKYLWALWGPLRIFWSCQKKLDKKLGLLSFNHKKELAIRLRQHCDREKNMHWYASNSSHIWTPTRVFNINSLNVGRLFQSDPLRFSFWRILSYSKVFFWLYLLKKKGDTVIV